MTASHEPSQVTRFKCAVPSLELNTPEASSSSVYVRSSRTTNTVTTPASSSTYILSPFCTLFKSSNTAGISFFQPKCPARTALPSSPGCGPRSNHAAFVGPFGFDIGALLANLVNNYIYHVVVTKDEDFQNWLLVTIKEVMEKFRDKFLNFWSEHKESALLVEGYLDNETLVRYKEKFVKNIIKESIGFAGCKMARRVYGVAGVEEIRGIEDKNLRAEAEKMALKIAREFVINYEKINSVDEILEIVKNAG